MQAAQRRSQDNDTAVAIQSAASRPVTPLGTGPGRSDFFVLLMGGYRQVLDLPGTHKSSEGQQFAFLLAVSGRAQDQHNA